MEVETVMGTVRTELVDGHIVRRVEFDEGANLTTGDRVQVPAYETAPLPGDGDRVEVIIERGGAS